MKEYFSVGINFELFYALTLLMEDNDNIHADWKHKTLSSLAEHNFMVKAKALGLNSNIWAVISDSIISEAPFAEYKDVRAAFLKLKPDIFLQKCLQGIFHFHEVCFDIAAKKISLEKAIMEILAPTKCGWLAYTGLYPYKSDSDIIRAFENMIIDPDRFLKSTIDLVDLFWKHSFSGTWESYLQKKLLNSAEVKSRLYYSSGLADFARQVLLPLEVKDNKIRALRGGFEIEMKEISDLYFIPSVFNYKKHWTGWYDNSGKFRLFVTYFDNEITLANLKQALVFSSDIDPEAAFKALGDSTRFAIVSLLANSPKSSVQIAKDLAISKTNTSHHINILKQAGLLNEQIAGGSIILSLRREVIENLSRAAISKIYAEKN